MEKKYIMIESSWGWFPIIFSAAMVHSDVARNVGGKPVSAGYFHTRIEDGKIKVECYGDSSSLNLKPSAGDEIYLEMLLNEKGRRS